MHSDLCIHEEGVKGKGDLQPAVLGKHQMPGCVSDLMDLFTANDADTAYYPHPVGYETEAQRQIHTAGLD